MKRNLNQLFWENSLISGRLFLKIGTIVLMIILPIFQLVAQEARIITGTITGRDNAHLAAATVVVTGTTNGTISSIDGTYSIDVTATDLSLTFSFLGYVTQTIDINGETIIDVNLVSEVSELDEAIVVGYGVRKKAALTGAVSQADGDEMIHGKGTSSLGLALQGEIPGLVVTRTSSRPGNEGLDLNIRGPISVNGIKPLILLDGLEIPAWELSQINPNDIESVTVLKDASAAIYGSKAGGGVILLTTKRGTSGKIKVSYSGGVQMNYVNKRLPLATMKEWAKLWLTVGKNDAITYLDNSGILRTQAPPFRFFTEEEFQQIVDGTFGDLHWYGSRVLHIGYTDQFDAMYGSTASHRHNLSLTGGTDKVSFLTTIGYAKDRSIIDFVNDGQKRYNIRTNVDYQINDIIKTEFNAAFDSRLVDEPTRGIGEGIQDMYIFPLYNPQGQYYDNFGGNNVLAWLDEGGRTTNKENVFRGGGKLILDFDKYISGLSVSASSNYRIFKGERNERLTQSTMYDWDGIIPSEVPSIDKTYFEVEHNNNYFQNYQVLANYSRIYNLHRLKLIAGLTSELIKSEWDSMILSKYDSYLARFNYEYNSMLLLEFLGSRDRSSRLHSDNRWANFGNASAGIVLSEVEFLKDKVFDFLKVRVSYGSTGSVFGVMDYDNFSEVNLGSTVFGVVGQLATTAWITPTGSTDWTLERISTVNTGFDFIVLNHRLSGSFDYFTRQNEGMLISVTYPSLLGGSPRLNSGELTARGWDATLSWGDKKGDFSYEIGGWVSDSRSEVARMEGAEIIQRGLNDATDGEIIGGRPINAIYVYRTEGDFFANEQEVLEYYYQYGFVDPADQTVMKPGTIIPAYRSQDKLVPGCVRRVDLSGPDGVPDGIINEYDLEYYGDANPHCLFGLNLKLQYKNIDFRAFFQGVGQQYMIRQSSLAFPFNTWWTNQNNTFIDNTWTENNTDAEWPRISLNGQRKRWNYSHPNDINVLNVGYIRARNLSLGYTFPKSFSEKVLIDRLRVYLSANEPFVIANVKDGLDPEKGRNTSRGNSVPYSGSILVGVDITF